MKNACVPIQKDHSNVMYKAPGCGDLPTTKTEDGIISIWKCKSLWERIKFLFHGEITLHISGDSQPPVAVFLDDIVFEVVE